MLSFFNPNKMKCCNTGEKCECDCNCECCDCGEKVECKAGEEMPTCKCGGKCFK